MNPLTITKNLSKLIDNEIKIGAVGTKKSWHSQYRDSAWVFFGGMPFELTEGDIICIFSQYGEVVNINLIRDKKTGKSKGFGFLCYENQLSTDLAVDNFNGTKILGRVIRVDHAGNYKPPKEHEEDDEVTKFLRESGCQGELHRLIESKEKDKTNQKEIKQEKDTRRDYREERKEEKSSKHHKKEKKHFRSKSRSRSRSRSKSKERHRDRDKYRNGDKDKHRHQYHHSSRY